MLPVRVKVLSSASCTFPEASAFLQRFLSGDACSDSLVRDYVANVAKALQDSIVWRSESKGAPPNVNGKLNGSRSDRDQRVIRSALVDEDSTPRRHKKKRKHSSIVDGAELPSPSFREIDDDTFLQHQKKKKRKEEPVEYIPTEPFTPDSQKKRKKLKCEGEAGMNNVAAYNDSETRGKLLKGREEHVDELKTEYTHIKHSTPDSQKRKKKHKTENEWRTDNVSPDIKNKKRKLKSPIESDNLNDGQNFAIDCTAAERLISDSEKQRKEPKSERDAVPVHEERGKKEKRHREREEHTDVSGLTSNVKGHHEKKSRLKKQETDLNVVEIARPQTTNMAQHELRKHEEGKVKQGHR
ncbi:hypothetical protein KP509_20G043700 [Ceratopteris richardii]|uniref:Uncharacterized protein n=1 Tax=Ceratopteris richardii TaxID=49495 RepID=A0A8T2SGK2_CERRI|nr:hypothetical protein KP509_20G043700 [Ceratopteris richardii]